MSQNKNNGSQNKNNDLSTLLGGIIAQAAKTPAHTGATEKFARRERNAGTNSVIVLDVSSSMSDRAGSRRKIDLLKEALTGVLPAGGTEILIAFSSASQEISSLAALPEPNGSTALHTALTLATTHRPRHTLIVSDGQPDDEGAALAAAEQMPGRIDVIYVGPDSDFAAITFMRSLARVGGGRVQVHDVTKQMHNAQLGQAIRGLLPAPGNK